MNFKILLIVVFISSDSIAFAIKGEKDPISQTIITSNNSTGKSYIEFGILNKLHHLYIGRCNPEHVKFHGENIILNNNGENHVTAVIIINVESNVYITCVNILDQVANGEGGFPRFLEGGVGHNFVKFEVTTHYGKGFNFYVEIYGYYL